MARIMCTQTLWRALGRRGQPPSDVEEPRLDGVVLGTWATKVLRGDGRRFVLALNIRTYLTLVFPLSPRARFRGSFASALETALEDLGVPRASRRHEAMAIDLIPLSRLVDRSLMRSLNQLEFLAQCELDYSDDLRRVQRNLNEYPHANRESCCAIDAVRELFSNARGSENSALVN